MKIQGAKGTRDFYPQDMRLRNWITDAWRRVSLRNGFEEYDAPIFEYLDLFTVKSGPEIAAQLFSFTDRGGRALAIRPEITPSLARMVSVKINSLPRPIKWFSVPRLCRAENPQKGRLREFFQWNIDVIGEDSELADAECVFAAVDAMRELGLTRDDVVVRYSSRALLSGVLKTLGLAQEKTPEVMAVLDKRSKVPAEAFEEMLAGAVPSADARAGLLRFLDTKDIASMTGETAASSLGAPDAGELARALEGLRSFEGFLRDFGVADWCRYDSGVVRGLAYYTGIVYEIFDAQASLRALAGGGRYDNLLEVLGGPKVGACGFGMGDVVLGILLQEKGKVPASVLGGSLDFYVIDAEDCSLATAMRVTGALRAKGLMADFSYKRQPTGKQLKEATRRGARRAVIVRGDGTVGVKDLSTGEQQDRPLEEFLARPV